MFKNPCVFRIAAAGLKLQRLTNVKKFHMIFTDCIADLSTIERCGPVGEDLLFPRKKKFPRRSLRNRHSTDYCDISVVPKILSLFKNFLGATYMYCLKYESLGP